MEGTHFAAYSISEDILKAIESLHYMVPTEVQHEVIPNALNKKDLIVKSQTGSGKTASFGIPICEMIDWTANKPQALVLTPTRELAIQVKEDIANIGRFKRVKVVALYGKSPFVIQTAELKQKTHVVVGTPGRMLDHIERGTIELGHIKYLVIDEADEMLNMGFIEQVQAIIQKLPTNKMTMLFSATLPKDVENLCRTFMKNPVHIEVKSTGITTEKIDHSLYEVLEADKFSLLQDVTIVENPDSCLIFCRTQEKVNVLYRQLADLSYRCDKIHGGMEQEERFEVMSAFKRAQFRYLVATDVAARGIDVEHITHVVNYDIPMEKEGYVHRTGRTGRAGRRGKAITFVTPYEQKWLMDIEQFIGFTIPKAAAPSREAVENRKLAFAKKTNVKPVAKGEKNEQLNQEIMKLYFNGGKKKKLRAIDFVGTLARLDGITAEDIGIITIHDHVTYIEILNGKGPLVLEVMQHTTIKGKLLKVEQAK